MTNKEIIAKIAEIRHIKNPCDRAIALAQFEPLYKKTQFYKTTHKSLQIFYYEIIVEDLLSLRTLLDNAQTFLNELDTSTLETALNDINTNTLATITEGVNVFNETGLADLIKKS